MKYKLLPLFIVLMTFAFSVQSQEVKNLKAEPDGNLIKITYDLIGGNRLFNILIYYSLDRGKTWLGPMLKITGDAGEGESPGINKLVIWDALAEQGSIDGWIQFKVVAEVLPPKSSKADNKPPDIKDIQMSKKDTVIIPEKILAAEKPWMNNPNFRKYKTAGIVWLTAAIVSGGIGIYSVQKGNNLYNEYKTATEKANDLRKQIKTFDLISPVAFGLAGLCGSGFVFNKLKMGNIRKQLTFKTYPINGGGGINLTFNF